MRGSTHLLDVHVGVSQYESRGWARQLLGQLIVAGDIHLPVLPVGEVDVGHLLLGLDEVGVVLVNVAQQGEGLV